MSDDRKHDERWYDTPEHRDEHQQAERLVQAFMREMESQYGIEPKEIHQFFDDVRWVGKHRAMLTRWGEWTGRSIFAAVTLGAVLALWEGIKHFLVVKSGG